MKPKSWSRKAWALQTAGLKFALTTKGPENWSTEKRPEFRQERQTGRPDPQGGGWAEEGCSQVRQAEDYRQKKGLNGPTPGKPKRKTHSNKIPLDPAAVLPEQLPRYIRGTGAGATYAPDLGRQTFGGKKSALPTSLPGRLESNVRTIPIRWGEPTNHQEGDIPQDRSHHSNSQCRKRAWGGGATQERDCLREEKCFLEVFRRGLQPVKGKEERGRNRMKETS